MDQPKPGQMTGKVAVVTGASRGIGRAIALALAREGASIVLAAKTEVSTHELPGSIHTVADEVRALGGHALPIRVDLRDEAQINAMREKTIDAYGRVDVVVNNAGALFWKKVLDTPVERFDLMIHVNVRAAFACTRAFLPHMMAGEGGHVVFLSPPLELAALPGKVAYLIGKFGMTMLALGLAEEMKPRIASNTLWPATAIRSHATEHHGFGSPRTWRTPQIVADALVELVTRDPKELTGQTLIDEDFLRSCGTSNFDKYRCEPDHEPPRVGLSDYKMPS